jgi:DNA-binding response OmpR family regulator
MPELDGWEAMLLMRAIQPGIPIVLMTGRAESEQSISGIDCEVLTQPFLPDSLLEKVQAFLPQMA